MRCRSRATGTFSWRSAGVTAAALAMAGCTTVGGQRWTLLAADEGHPAARLVEGPPNSDAGDLEIACAGSADLRFTRYWIDRKSVRAVTLGGVASRRIAVRYDADGMGAATFTLPQADPWFAGLRAGRAATLAYDDGQVLTIRPGARFRALLALCGRRG